MLFHMLHNSDYFEVNVGQMLKWNSAERVKGNVSMSSGAFKKTTLNLPAPEVGFKFFFHSTPSNPHLEFSTRLFCTLPDRCYPSSCCDLTCPSQGLHFNTHTHTGTVCPLINKETKSSACIISVQVAIPKSSIPTAPSL